MPLKVGWFWHGSGTQTRSTPGIRLPGEHSVFGYPLIEGCSPGNVQAYRATPSTLIRRELQAIS
jgi:hypothetical protein